MTAACRALETARPAGFVRDPSAERVAGGRGMAITRALPRLEIMCFGVGARVRFLDELVVEAIAAHGIEAVLSIGCGLETRPWRLEAACFGSERRPSVCPIVAPRPRLPSLESPARLQHSGQVHRME